MGAQIRIAAGSRVRIPLDPAWEHAVVLLDGDLEAVALDDDNSAARPGRNDLFYLGTDRDHVELASNGGALVFLLGGEPFEDELVMWWNFVGRSHEEIVEARDEWESRSAALRDRRRTRRRARPGPPMPSVRLAPRSNRHGRPLT